MKKNLVASAIAGAIALANGCQSEKVVYKFPEFKAVVSAEKDPVVKEAQTFYHAYQTAVKVDPESAQNNFDASYNDFARKVKPFVVLPEASSSDGGESYFRTNDILSDYLRNRGWLFRIGDSFFTTETGEQIAVRFLILGKVHSLRQSTVVGLDGKPIKYSETIVADARQTKARGQTFRLTSFTEGTNIYHFLEEYVKIANEIEKNLQDGGVSSELNASEWSGVFEKLGRTKQFNDVVLSDLLRGSSMHEREHVIDHEISEFRQTKEAPAVAKVKLIMEIRGLLAQIAYSGSEIYGLGHALDWADSSDTINRIAGDTVLNIVGLPPKDNLDPRKYLREKAKQELEKSNEIVSSALKFKDDPDPIDRARRAHEGQK